MFTPADISTLTTVAQVATGRIGKRIAYASGDADGVWRNPDDVGKWVKPKDIGAGSDTTANRRQYHYRVLQGEPTIEWRKSLREQISTNTSLSLIGGVLAEDRLADLSPAGDHWISPLWPRNNVVLRDAPRAFFTLDLDGLDLGGRGFDALEHDGELPDILADIFDTSGLDWLIADCVMQLSSSHGIMDRTSVRAHIDWHLDKPLTLAEQKILARHINAAVAAAGYSDRIVDETIYDPARLLFTAPAELFRRTIQDGRIVNVPEPAPHLQRVRLVSRGQGRLTDIPEHVWTGLRAARAVKRIAKPRAGAARQAGNDAARKPLSLSIEPGNVYAPIRARIYRAARETPRHQAEAAKARIKADLRAKLEALPDHAEYGLRRMRYLANDEFERSWQGALEQRYGWRVARSQSAAYPASVPIETARASLAAHMSRAIQEGINYAANAAEGDNLSQEPPKHLLLRTPPGVGKTEATINAVSVAHLMSERISYLAPSTRLAEEATARMRKRVPGDEYSQSRVRQMRGRRQVCKDARYGKLAERVEALSLSPLKSVCGYCPRRDACPWPAQHGNTDSGFVTGQHAHATTTLAKIKDASSDQAPAVGIVDESMLGTLLRQKHPAIKIDTLSRWAKRGAIKKADGETLHMPSIDMVAYRVDLVAALAAAPGVMPMSRTLSFARTVRVRRGDETESMPSIVAAMRAEKESSRYYHAMVNESLDAYHEAQAAGRSTRPAERQLTKAAAQLKIIDWFRTAYRAIYGSMSVPGRKHVFGLRVSNGRVSVHIRTDLPAVMRQRHWIWLDGTADPDVWAALVKGGKSAVNAMERRLDVLPGSYTLTQFPDKPYGKRFLTDGAADHQASNLARLRRYIVSLSLRHEQVLVVAQLPVAKRLTDAGMPDNVHVEHFNALRGLDRYKTVPCACIIGRPQPAQNDLEAMTEALHYDNADVPEIVSAAQAYITTAQEIPLAGEGRPVAIIKSESHPDPHVRAMRRQLVDAEVRQAIMRLRLFDRDDNNPADLHVFGQCDTGLIADTLLDWADAQVDVPELLIAQGALTRNATLAPILVDRLMPGISPRRAVHYMQEAIRNVKWPKQTIVYEGHKYKVYARSQAIVESLLA